MVLVLSVMLKQSGSEDGLSKSALGLLMLGFSAYPFFHEAMARVWPWIENLLAKCRTRQGVQQVLKDFCYVETFDDDRDEEHINPNAGIR